MGNQYIPCGTIAFYCKMLFHMTYKASIAGGGGDIGNVYVGGGTHSKKQPLIYRLSNSTCRTSYVLAGGSKFVSLATKDHHEKNAINIQITIFVLSAGFDSCGRVKVCIFTNDSWIV